MTSDQPEHTTSNITHRITPSTLCTSLLLTLTYFTLFIRPTRLSAIHWILLKNTLIEEIARYSQDSTESAGWNTIPRTKPGLKRTLITQLRSSASLQKKKSY